MKDNYPFSASAALVLALIGAGSLGVLSSVANPTVGVNPLRQTQSSDSVPLQPLASKPKTQNPSALPDQKGVTPPGGTPDQLTTPGGTPLGGPASPTTPGTLPGTGSPSPSGLIPLGGSPTPSPMSTDITPAPTPGMTPGEMPPDPKIKTPTTK